MPDQMRLPSNVLPQFDRKITRRKWGEKGHTYIVEGIPCERCAACAKGNACTGMPGCTSISGAYKTGDLYGAGYRAAFNAVFGAYVDMETKDEVKDGGWLTDFLRTESNTATNAPFDSLKEELLRYRQEAEEIPTPSKIATDFGSAVHTAIEEALAAQQTEEESWIDPKVYQATRNVVEWLDKMEYKVLDYEVTVYHPTMLYAGTIDCVAERQGNITLMDWKTGNSLYADAQAQLAGYALAYKELTGIDPTTALVLRSRNDFFEALEVVNLDIAKVVFGYLAAIKASWPSLVWKGVA